MVKLRCNDNLAAVAYWIAGFFCSLLSQTLFAQGSSAPAVQRSAVSIFNTIGLDTSTSVIKSENDKRDYRYLVLENELRVLLISDPITEKSAAALDVNIGANQNPADRAGLAHLLEHMLFLGTEKYPTAGEYQEFISRHGGSFNAYTAAENTNYFFDIDNDQLDAALDRFAQFFVAPLFNADYVERERNAVNSEYLAKVNDDARREWDVYRELMNPLHPSATFSVGNYRTLADREGHAIRDDLVAFYEQHYSSHLMSLVVLGRESLDTLEANVRARFAAVPLRDVEVKDYPALFVKQQLPASVEIKPQKELRQLTFNFPIPNPDQFYDKKPFTYIANLLGHEAEGSLLSLLKRLGWAEAIYADTGLKSRNDAVFRLRIQLTPEGVRARNQIVSLVFHSIEQVRARGLSPWRYGELQQLASLAFRFQEKRAPIRTVSALAETMKTYSANDILRGDYLYAAYDERLLKKSLSYLNSNNVLLVLAAPEIEPFRVSPLYAVPFAVRRGIPDVLELKPAVRKELFLPEKNLFMPNRLIVKAGSMLEENAANTKPQLILENKHLQVWFAQDRQFAQPRALVNLRIKSPLIASSAEGAAQAHLFAALINDRLNEFAYPAKLAGIDHSITAYPRGYDITIFGYSSRQGLLINKIMESMRITRFKEERFALVKENLLRNWRNQNKDLPHQVLAKQVPVLQTHPYWSNTQLIAALENKTLEQFSRFANRQLIDAKLEALFYGNYFRAEALKLGVFVEHELLARQTGREMPPAMVLMFPEDSKKPWLSIHDMDHPDSIAELLVQSLSTSLDDSAHMMLIRQLLQPAFYNGLRTEKQLGYVVAVIATPMRKLESTLFVIQSPNVTNDNIIGEIDAFLEAQHSELERDFAAGQQALINKLREPARSLREQGARYWQTITTYDNDFAYRPDLADAVARISVESISNYYRTVFMDKNRRLWLTSNAPLNAENFTVIDDIQAHKKQMQSVVQP